MGEMTKTSVKYCRKYKYSYKHNQTEIMCGYYLQTRSRRGCPVGMCDKFKASISTVSAGMSGGNGVGTGLGNFNQTINVNQQISTPDELARAVRVESKQGLMRGAYGY